MPSVLWTFRTTHRRSTSDTPYSLTYGTNVIIPLEVRLPTLRTTQVETVHNDQALEEVLDFAESRKKVTSTHLANYQSTLTKQRKTHTNPREFKVDKLILRKTLGTTAQSMHGKLR